MILHDPPTDLPAGQPCTLEQEIADLVARTEWHAKRVKWHQRLVDQYNLRVVAMRQRLGAA